MSLHGEPGFAFSITTKLLSMGLGALKFMSLWRRVSLPSWTLRLSHRHVSMNREVAKVCSAFLGIISVSNLEDPT